MTYQDRATNLIIKWLKENGCSFSKKATSSESIYFTRGELHIRISTHLPSNSNPNVIYIFIANNEKKFAIFYNRRYLAFDNIANVKTYLLIIFELIEYQMLDIKPTLIAENNALKTKVENQTKSLKIIQESYKKLKDSIK